MFQKVIKRTAIVLGVIASIPAGLFIAGFSYGAYLGYQEVLAIEAMEDDFEAYLALTDRCGEIETKAEYDEVLECKNVCGTFFECRNEYLMMEYDISMAIDEYDTENYLPAGEKKVDL